MAHSYQNCTSTSSKGWTGNLLNSNDVRSWVQTPALFTSVNKVIKFSFNVSTILLPGIIWIMNYEESIFCTPTWPQCNKCLCFLGMHRISGRIIFIIWVRTRIFSDLGLRNLSLVQIQFIKIIRPDVRCTPNVFLHAKLNESSIRKYISLSFWHKLWSTLSVQLAPIMYLKCISMWMCRGKCSHDFKVEINRIELILNCVVKKREKGKSKQTIQLQQYIDYLYINNVI